MILTTDILDPNRQHIIENFNKELSAVLPCDYISFLREYGTGVYNDEVLISYPDDQNIPSTFGDVTDFWELDDDYTAEDLLTSIQIGSTANGDIICVTNQRIGKMFVLPRHSTSVTSFAKFDDAIQSFLKETTTFYFDPLFDSNQIQITLINSSGSLIDILPIHELFLQKFPYDFAMRKTTQPKYFFKSFGGWVTFDLIYKNTITVKFQNQHFEKASSVIDFLKKCLE